MAQFSMEIMRLTGSLLRGNQQSTTLSILQIALATGFPSHSHFSKVYREKYGNPPNETRSSARGNGRSSPLNNDHSEDVSWSSLSMTA
jgi:AraC-like DNA-binding protein